MKLETGNPVTIKPMTPFSSHTRSGQFNKSGSGHANKS